MGSCCYETASNGSSTLESAGTLTVDDGKTTIATLTAPPYVATNGTVTSLTWTAGSTLKVSASGATVDAFDLSVVAPALLTGVSPALTAAIKVSKSAKLVVTWTPGTEACSKVTFGLTQTSTSTALPHIGCVVDDSAGTLTVPEELIAKFTATTGSATLERVESAGVNVTNANVKLVVADTELTTVTYTP